MAGREGGMKKRYWDPRAWWCSGTSELFSNPLTTRYHREVMKFDVWVMGSNGGHLKKKLRECTVRVSKMDITQSMTEPYPKSLR